MKLNKHQIENPRYDLWTNEILNYKSKDQYYNSYYNNRTNLVKHFKNNNDAESLSKTILKNIVELKQIEYLPSTVECKTFTCPCFSPALMDILEIDYLKIAKDLKLKRKFLYKGFDKYIFNNLINKIYVDSREQTPFSFDCQTEIAGLKFGDYSASLDISDVVVIERKSANDFIGTMSKGYERFCREIEKARDKKSKVLMIVENDINYMLSYNYLPQFKWVKASPEFIFSRLRSVLQAFSNFQVLFCKDKNEASYFTRLILSNPEMFKWDLQYLYDTKQIKKI